jgi:hypothetical protein
VRSLRAVASFVPSVGQVLTSDLVAVLESVWEGQYL